MKKDTLIRLYWILDALQKGHAPDARDVGTCFIAIRDELLRPDTEEIVDHIRGALMQTQAAADVLTDEVIGSSRRRPLADSRLVEMMLELAATRRLPAERIPEAAVAFGRLVEAAHGIG